MYTSSSFKDSLREICEEWSVDDLLDAHMLLDAQEAAESRARARVASKANRK